MTDGLGLDLNSLSEGLSKKLGRAIVIEKAEPVGKGFHSEGFKITSKTGETFFMRKMKSYKMGFAFPERKISSLNVSHRMANRIKGPKSIGVFVEHKGKAESMPEFDENTAIYNIQEFESEGTSYWSLLEKKKNKTKVDEEDLKELEKITDFIVDIHKIKYPSKDEEEAKEVYSDSLRSILGHPELTFTFLHQLGDDHPIFSMHNQKEYIGLMINLMHKWKDRSDRLSALHGDFWGANIFFRKDSSLWVVDFSRIPWGDNAVDIAWFTQQYLWFYCMTGNNYYKELGEEFLKMYERKSGDKEVRKAMCLALGVLGLIVISTIKKEPSGYYCDDMDQGRKFYNIIVQIMQNGEFKW